MGDLLIRNVSEMMKQNISERASRAGVSLSEEAKKLLNKGMAAEDAEPVNGPSAWDVLRPVLFDENAPEAGEEFARIMDEIEAERKKDFGRPVEGFE